MDDWDLFASNLEEAGGCFMAAADADEVKEILAGLIKEIGAKTAVAYRHPLLDRVDLAGIFETSGVSLKTIENRDELDSATREALASADLGVTSADALLAESGSIALAAGSGRSRAVSLLPPVHVAVAGPGSMLADITGLPALINRLSEESGRPPSAVHLITGPSSTADIEQTLVRGIHGPMKLYVLAVKAI
jgi:L-lactate dehydrogenase complex protein LldG